MTPARVALGIGAVVSALLAASSSAAAQSLTYGVKGGLGLSKMVFSEGFADDTSLSPGLVAGGGVAWRIVNRLSAGAEGLFVTERVSITDSITDRFQYLDMPLLGRYEALMLGGHTIAASGGYVYRWLLDATEEIAGESSSIKEGIASSGGSIAVGGDVQLTARLRAGVRYVHGQSGVYKRLTGGTVGRGRAVQITFEWRLR